MRFHLYGLLVLIAFAGNVPAQTPPSLSSVGASLGSDQDVLAAALGDFMDTLENPSVCENLGASRYYYIYLCGELLALLEQGKVRINNFEGSPPPPPYAKTAPDYADDGTWDSIGEDTWTSGGSNCVGVSEALVNHASLGVIGAALLHEGTHFDDDYTFASGYPSDPCAYMCEELIGFISELELLECYMFYCVQDEEEGVLIGEREADLEAARVNVENYLADNCPLIICP